MRTEDVFLVWHAVADRTRGATLVGVYSSEQKARSRIERIRRVPALAREPHEFVVTCVPMDAPGC